METVLRRFSPARARERFRTCFTIASAARCWEEANEEKSMHGTLRLDRFAPCFSTVVRFQDSLWMQMGTDSPRGCPMERSRYGTSIRKKQWLESSRSLTSITHIG